MRALLILALLAPSAAAMDLLPSELHLGETEARILVRSSEGIVRVETEPSILAAASAPEGSAESFAPTPRVLAANSTWRGLEGIVVVVLRRADPREVVDITIEDGSRTGVSIEWPASARAVPLGAWIGVIALGLAIAWRGRRDVLPSRPPS